MPTVGVLTSACQPTRQPTSRPASQPASRLVSQPTIHPARQPANRPNSELANEHSRNPASMPPNKLLSVHTKTVFSAPVPGRTHRWIDVRVNIHMRVLNPIDFHTRKIDLCFCMQIDGFCLSATTRHIKVTPLIIYRNTKIIM